MDDKEKYIEIEGRRFVVKKFSAKVAIKMTKTLLAKGLPAFSAFTGGNTSLNIDNKDFIDDNTVLINSIGEVLDKLSDEDLDKVIDTSLLYCSEILPAGQVTVLNKDGTFGVIGVEDDLILTLRLITEVLMFNYMGFFDESRWGSTFKSVVDMLPSKA